MIIKQCDSLVNQDFNVIEARRTLAIRYLFVLFTGYYCPGPGESDYLDKPCPKGYYCLAGTTLSTDFPCPGGTYNPAMNASSQIACKPCVEGNYCPVGTAILFPCPAGFWCTASQLTGYQNACPIGTYSNETGLKSKYTLQIDNFMATYLLSWCCSSRYAQVMMPCFQNKGKKDFKKTDK
jgi:hypothetical protein